MDKDFFQSGGNNGGGKQWSESEDTIKVKPREFANKLDLECERNIVVQDDSNVTDLRNWKSGIVINRCGNEYGEWKGNQELDFGHGKFEMIHRQPSGCQVTGYLCQKFGDESGL